MNRKIHRWVSLPIAIIMLLVALTGIVLEVEEFGKGEAPPATAQQSKPLGNAEISALLNKALIAANEVKPGFSGKRIEINMTQGAPKVMIAQGGRGSPSVEFDAATGKPSYRGKPPMSLHVLMIQLHTGRMAGTFGLVLVLLSGIILTILSVTGMVVYYDMWKRRTSSGKRGPLLVMNRLRLSFYARSISKGLPRGA